MSDRTESLSDVINAAVANASRSLYTCVPAKVIKWEPDKQRANCQILIKEAFEDEEGNQHTESVAVIPGVPVQFMGAGGYRLTLPIGDGSGGTEETVGMLFFAHRSMDKWLSGKGGEVDPEIYHDHALHDAVFVPGLKPFGAPWQDVPTSGISLGKDSGLQVNVTDDLITLAQTSGSAQFVALANKVNAELTKISTTLGTGTSVSGGAVSFTSPYTRADVDASKVKAE